MVAVVFNVIHCLSKLSILLSYQGLSPQAWWKWAIRAAMFLVIGYCTSLFFALLFACNPVHKAWDVSNYVDRAANYEQNSLFITTSDNDEGRVL
jgi:hypothetical protein